ncbi:hypothetical protein GCM10022403_008750 [Streptomyces coacervatus]|uniref:Uncharacterized protein n=1 Tax=Streptomyces coacervatus TaxID=647381 RepID=A0ABP7GWL0_9ACTN
MPATPASARWNAALAPITPPPMITTSAVGGTERKVDEEDKSRPFRRLSVSGAMSGAVGGAVRGESLISYLPVIVTQSNL